MALKVKNTQIKNFGFVIERTMKRIRQDLQRRLNEMQAGITVDQWVILDLLSRRDGIGQNEIADRTYKDAPTVTRIIDLLCKKNLATRERDDNDRRRFRITLTQEGKERVRLVLPTVLELRRQGWDGLTDEDYANLMRILNTVYHNFDAEGAEEAVDTGV